MNIVEYELYDLNRDISQTRSIIDQFDDAETFMQIIDKTLKDIQINGYRWENLPSMENRPRIIKTEFNPY